jgi:VIT1/CCC1 family predicted Fe2+/Mn2+ transporter
MQRRLLALPVPDRPVLSREDYLAAFGIFVLVVVATFPVVLPFMLVREPALAMRISQTVTVVMLFVAGFALGRHAGHARPLATGAAMSIFGVVLIAAVKALGG